MTIASSAAVTSTITRGGRAAQAMSKEMSSPFDVWSHSHDGLAQRMQSSAADPASILAADPAQQARAMAAALNMPQASANQIEDSMVAQAGALGDQVNAIGDAQGTLQTVGATFALLTSVEQMLSTLLSAIPFPSLPALRIADFDIGLPHAHSHPPNLIPPAPPVPLPSTGPVIPIPILSGATATLINGMPAARCGDMGLGVWCGGYFPMYEVFLGSSNVWIEGMRAARLLVDITRHCLFTVPKPQDPPLGPMLGLTISASPNVLVGGIPMPSLTAIALGQAMKGAFKLAGKGARGFARLTAPLRRRLASHLDEGFLKCKLLRGEPVNFVTGEVAVDQQDYEIPARISLTWSRHYRSHSTRRGVCGHGWTTPADARLVIETDGSVTFFDGRGGAKIFPDLPSQGRVREFVDGAVLENEQDTYRVRIKNGLTYVFTKSHFQRNATELLVQRIEDRCGNALSFVRDANGLSRIHDRAGRCVEVKSTSGLICEMRLRLPEHATAHPLVRYEYSESGELLAAYDSLGNPYRFRYEQRRIVQHTDRNGLSFYYAYESDKPGARCHRAWGDGGLHRYRFDLDPCARRITVRNSLDAVSTIQLNELDLPIWEIDPLGGITRYEYDDCGRTIGVTDPGDRKIGYEYDAHGNLLKLTRPDGRCIECEFDADDKLIAIQDASGARWEQKWDARALMIEQVSPLGHVGRYEYDASGQPTAYTNPLGARTEFAYDAVGNLTTLRDALGHETRFAFDSRGNLTTRTDALGRHTSYRYDAKNRLTEMRLPSGATLYCAYDAQDNLIRHVDENGAETRFEYCGLGEVARRIRPDGSSVQYHYDTEERLIGVTNPRGERFHLKRDAAGRIVEEIDYWGQSTAYRLDRSGYLQQSRDALGRILYFKTDDLGQILSKRCAHPLRAGRMLEETFHYDSTGNLIACANEHVRLERRYDAEGRMLEEQLGDFVVRNTFDALGRRVKRETSIGNCTICELDALGRPTAVRINDEPPIILEHDAVGRLLKETLAPSLERHYRYDAADRPTIQGLVANKQWLFRTEYAYDLGGNLTHRQDSQYGTQIYRYDPLRQIVEHIDPQGRLQHFFHDPAGDRLLTRVVEQPAQQVVGGTETLALWSREGSYEGIHYGFDRAGNLVERRAQSGTTALTWDGNQQLVRSLTNGVETLYGYDPLGRRIFKQTGNQRTRFAWDGDALLLETSGDGHAPPAREYVYRPGTYKPLALLDEGGGTYHYHTDPNGCPTRLTRRDGHTVWAALYAAWGAAKVLVEEVRNPLRLQGQYQDDETGLHYNRFRYYDPLIGTFISHDPIRLAAGEHTYRYAPNALAWIDPLGLMCAARAGKNFDADFYKNQYRRVTRSELAEADPFTRADGMPLDPHPNKHSVPKNVQVDVLNNWQKSYSGINYNGRPVDIYWKDGTAVVTQSGQKHKVITAYDNVEYQRWADPSRWKKQGPGVYQDEAYHAFNRNNQR